jgi:hypothetical protein
VFYGEEKHYPKSGVTFIHNTQSIEPIAQSAKKYIPPPQPCMSKLIKIAKEVLKKARLEREARLLKVEI